MTTAAEKNSNNYYLIGGDAYDGGVDCKVYVNGKKVYKGWRAGELDWTYKGVDYDYIDKMLTAIALDNGLTSFEDFKRYVECEF